MAEASGYDFSPFYHATANAISPGSTFLATIHQSRLIVRTTANLSIVRTWQITPSSAPAPINQAGSGSGATGVQLDTVQWSDDGLYILVFSRQEASGWVFGLADEGRGGNGEVARIKAEAGGVDGLERVEWAAGGREVLGWTEHGLRLLVFSLPTGRTSVIHNPKGSTGCCSASPDHRYLAVVERHSGKESVGVYDMADEYQLIRHFALQATDVQSISWSPCGRYIAVVDSRLSYSLYVHSPIGPVLTHFSHLSSTFSLMPSASSISGITPSGLSNNKSTSSSLTVHGEAGAHEDPGLGIRQADWAPNGQYVVLSGYDGKLRVLEVDGWRCLAVLSPGQRVGKGVTIWREPEGWVKDTRGRGIVQFDRIPSTSSIPTAPPTAASSSSLAASSTSDHLISPSGRHILHLPLSQPHVLHIYSFLPAPTGPPEIRHKAAIIFAKPVRCAKWAGGAGQQGRGKSNGKGKERIGVVCKGSAGAVYVWDEEGWEDVLPDGVEGGGGGGVMEGIGIPNGAKFAPSDIHFSPDGLTLALQARGEFCMMYDTDDEPFNDDLGGAKGAVAHINECAAEGREWDQEGLSFVREEDEEEDA